MAMRTAVLRVQNPADAVVDLALARLVAVRRQAKGGGKQLPAAEVADRFAIGLSAAFAKWRHTKSTTSE